jgi:hypothetical protein
MPIPGHSYGRPALRVLTLLVLLFGVFVFRAT